MTETNDNLTMGPSEGTQKPPHIDPSQKSQNRSSNPRREETTEPMGARDKAEATRDLDYVIRLSQRHCRLYSRLHATIRFVELLGGSAAVGVAFSGSPEMLKIAGAVIAVVACANFAFDPGAKARDFERTGQDLSAVRAQVAALTMEKIDQRRNLVTQPDFIEGLRVPAWNDMMRSHGFGSSAKRLNLWQWFMAAIA